MPACSGEDVRYEAIGFESDLPTSENKPWYVNTDKADECCEERERCVFSVQPI